MSILNYNLIPVDSMKTECVRNPSTEDRWERNIREDIKQGMDLIFEFKEKLNKLHPLAQEVLVGMLSQ